MHRIRPFVLALALVPLPLAGCAAEVEPLRVRAADLGRAGPLHPAEGQAVVIEFQEGDLVPIDLSFTGDLIELSPPSPDLAFRARRRFFLKMGKKDLAVSLDGVHFGDRPREPGSFRLGLSATAQGTRVHVDVKTPRHVEPGG